MLRKGAMIPADSSHVVGNDVLQEKKSWTVSAKTWVLVLGFALGMMVHELFLEALFRLPDVPKSMALWSSTFQFASCALLPVLLEMAGSREADKLDTNVHKVVSTQLLHCDTQTRDMWKRWMPYVALAAFMFASATAANHAVHFVDYTVKIVAKSSKLLPTMVAAPLLGNSMGFSAPEYFAAILLCGGTAAFFHGGNTDVGNNHGMTPAHQIIIGMMLLAFATIVDGVVPNFQQVLMRNGDSANVLMMRSNVIGAVSGFGGLVLSGNAHHMLLYAQQVPIVWPLLLCVGSCLAVSVSCYVRLIDVAGAAITVAVSTLRKVLTLGCSFLFFPGKSFGIVRAVGLCLVFGGLLLAEYAAKTRKKHASSVRDVASEEGKIKEVQPAVEHKTLPGAEIESV